MRACARRWCEMASGKKGAPVDYVVLRGCVQHNGQRVAQGNVLTLSESEAQRLLRLGVIVPLAEMKGDGRTG